LKSAGFHAPVVWQLLQAENEPGWCVLGLLWHALQAVGVPEYTLFLWHLAQLTDLCAPVSGKSVWL